MTPAGFPHSDISGSTSARDFPELFAACHVLHRLLAPRHPPRALCSLTSLNNSPNGSRQGMSGIITLSFFLGRNRSAKRLDFFRSRLHLERCWPVLFGPAVPAVRWSVTSRSSPGAHGSGVHRPDRPDTTRRLEEPRAVIGARVGDSSRASRGLPDIRFPG